jgi:acetyl esterase/lipase
MGDSDLKILRTVFAVLWLVLLSLSAFAAPAPRVAVFFQPGFPYFNVPVLISPKEIAADLSKAGVRADLLDAAALADPQRFNIQTYTSVVMPYGNYYPLAAFANLKAFHQAGGGFVLSGTPFTHAVAHQAGGTWKDLGHNGDAALFGPGGIGVGGFTAAPSGHVSVAPGDPLGLNALGLDWGSGANTQTMDPSTLPTEDKVIPILVADSQPVAMLIVHGDDAFKGAIDVWTTNGLRADDSILTYAQTQLLTRGTVALLNQKGLLPATQQQVALAALDKLPKPHLLTDVTLPTPPRYYPTIQPKMPPPAQHLYVADISKLPQAQKLLLTSLQGLVNRTQPRIYLVNEADDTFWLDQMQAFGQTGTPIPVADPMSLLTMFRSSYHGAVVPDPKVYDSPCVAVDIAGLDDLVIATPELADQYKLTIKNDLRGKFKNDADAFHYARTQLLPHLNPYLATSLDPAILGSQVDDIIAAKGMCFWVTGPKAQDRPGADESAERSEIEATLAQMPLGAVIRGFWWRGDGMGLDETPGVALGSRFGKITTVSDYVANYSVTSGVQLASLKQKPQPPAPVFDPKKVYIALTMSDGDNFCTWRDYFRQYFTDPLHGTFPLAFGMGPSLIDTSPVQAEWYYTHAAPTDEFLCDVSGAGYIYPPDFATALKDRPAALRSFYELTQTYMDRMDMHTLRLMGVGRDDIADAGKSLPRVSFLMPDYGEQGEKGYSDFTYSLPTRQPIFRAGTFGPGAQKLADEVRSHVGATRPAFLNAFIWNWGSKMSDLKGMLDNLGPEYVAVTPSQLNQLYRQAQGSVTMATEPTTVNVWPGLAPGETTSSPGRVTDDRSGGVSRLTDVTQPQLHLYPASGTGPHPTVVVCPGGGYGILAADLEGSEVARWLNTLGFTAAVLDYRVPNKREAAFQDGQQALSLLREHAADYDIDPHHLGVLGFSAGGHLAARLAATGQADARPDFALLIYPAYLIDKATGSPAAEVRPTAGMPPVFLMQTRDDPYLDAPAYAAALQAAGVPAHAVIYDTGGHGYGLRLHADQPAHAWSDEAAAWLKQQVSTAP